MLDIVSVLEIGLVSAGITLGGALVSLRFLENRLESRFLDGIEQFLTSFLGNIAENPKQFADTVKPILSALMKELIPPDLQKKVESMGPEGAALALNFLPKKWRGIGSIALGFIKNSSESEILPKSGTSGVNNANKSPFS